MCLVCSEWKIRSRREENGALLWWNTGFKKGTIHTEASFLKSTSDLLVVSFNVSYAFICASFSFGDSTEGKCVLILSLQIQGNDQGNVWKKNPKHFNFLDKCKHPKQRIIVTTLVSFSQSNYCKGIWINVNEQSQEKTRHLNKNFFKKDIQFTDF